MDTKKIGAFLKQCRKEKKSYTRTACRKVWRIGENRFQMGDRIEYAGSKYIG